MQSDAANIVKGVRDKSFLETFQFWAGPWALVGFDFYRPIPSVLWWAMYHSFGENGLAWFLGILALSHVVATLLLWRFLCYLFRSEVLATVATCSFAVGLAHTLFQLATPAYALELWIDSVEPWLMIAYVATCWAFVKYLRDGGRWLFISLFLFVVAICVKESSYTFAMLALVLLWYERKLENWRTLLWFVFVAIGALLYRTWVLHGLGTRFGSNGSWLPRALMEMGGGLPVAALTLQDGLPLFVGGIIVATLMLFLERRRHALAFALLSAAGFAFSAWHSAGMEDPFYYRLLGSSLVWDSGLTTALWLMIVYLLIRCPTREQKLGLAWVAVTYSVLLSSPTTQHTLYLTSVGFAIVLAPLFCNAVDFVTDVNPKLATILQFA
jgi:hypothetical protein